MAVLSCFAKEAISSENIHTDEALNRIFGEDLVAAVMPPEPCTTGAVSYCYGNNETTEITYCSSDADVEVAYVTLLNYSFEACCDKIEFYQGTGTSGPLLGSITGNGTSGYSYIGEYTANGGDGCVTVLITSDGSVSCDDGDSTPTTWEVGCQTICYPPTAVLEASVEEICSTEADNQDNSQTVVFSASNSVHNQGTSFDSYEWDFGDGSTTTTATPVVSHTYSDAGGYIVSLVVTDDLGCNSTVLEEVLLKLSGAPTFNLSNDADIAGVCPGTEVILNPSVTPYTWTEPEIQPDPDPTVLPDGTGSSYSSTVFFNQFSESDVIEDGSNITIMLNFEHSYMGDLDIDLVSPDGTRLNLLNFFTNGMGNCNVGGAGEYNGGEGPPGTGDEYYFNVSAGTAFSSFSGPGSTSAVGVDIPPGTYSPDDSFAGFNGSPINGVWEVLITDNYNLDDGTLFTWSIDLGPVDAAKITLEEFETTQQSAVWSGENVVGNTATPTTSGTATYTLTYTDNFGCVHTEETSFTVLPQSNPSCNQAPIADDETVSTNEDSAVSFDLNEAVDPDGDTLTYIIVATAPNGVLNCTQRSCSFTPTANFNGTSVF
ncbi:MAG: PKD domain-containing protein [Flavobacteriales bacterium]